MTQRVKSFAEVAMSLQQQLQQEVTRANELLSKQQSTLQQSQMTTQQKSVQNYDKNWLEESGDSRAQSEVMRWDGSDESCGSDHGDEAHVQMQHELKVFEHRSLPLR